MSKTVVENPIGFKYRSILNVSRFRLLTNKYTEMI